MELFVITGAALRGRLCVALCPLICCTRRILLLGVLNKDVEEEIFRRLLDIPLCDKSVNDNDGTRSFGSSILGGLASSDMLSICAASEVR